MSDERSRGSVLRCLWAGALFGLLVGASGCRVTQDDIQRWERTEMGPVKLVAVVKHDKYDLPLRRDAAIGLLRMRPRNGQRLGIQCETRLDRDLPAVCVQEALASLPPDERRRLVGELVPVLVTEMGKPAPAEGANGLAPPDPSVPYKDGAFAILTYDKAPLVLDEEQRKALRGALVKWATSDFERRLAITSQAFGPEQILRQFGAESAPGLIAHIRTDGAYDKAANLVADVGDQATKDQASQKLVELAKYTESQAWVDKTKPQVQASNKAAGYNVEGDKLEKQVRDFQEEQLIKVYASMKRVGGRTAVDYLLGVATDPKRSEKRRLAALAALEGRLDRNNQNDVQRIMTIASAEDTPDAIRDLAFQRVGELPRELVAGKLYELFASPIAAKKWKIRWVAASTVLKMSSAKDVPEFLGRLPGGNAPGFAMSEPLTYGDQIGKMNPPAPRDAVLGHLRQGTLAQRLTAIGYLYAHGKAADAALLAPLEDDKTALPKVEDPEGKWQCGVAKPGGKPGETEMHETTTVGDFVKTCVTPVVRARK
ncbi:MAG TPA: hypothetical protein VFS43_20500 [Polyangiaceae bacterium]|nr:hypothetical protein [Polyangiaceae bacterium]